MTSRQSVNFDDVKLYTAHEEIFYYEIISIKVNHIYEDYPQITILARGYDMNGFTIYYDNSNKYHLEDDLNYLFESTLED